MRLVIVAVPSRAVGMEALDRLRAAEDEGRLGVEDAALVYRDADRSVKLHQTRDAGAGVGALAAKWRDHGIDNAMLERLGDLLEGREAAVVVLADEASADLLTARVAELVDGGAELDYEVVPPEAQDLIREAIEQGLGTG